MDQIVIRGGRRLTGEVEIGGAKNAALPLLFSSLLTASPCRFRNLPEVFDIRTTLHLLQNLGAEVLEKQDHEVHLRAREISRVEATYELVRTMRASFLTLGPLLARIGRARVSNPGGCAIGARPVDLHLAGFEQMGASIAIVHGYVEAEAPRAPGGERRLRGARIRFEAPSVGATENLMMAAALADGTTVLENAAREPEIVDLAAALGRMGAKIDGAGSPTVTIDGVRELGGVEHDVIPDRIEAGTFAVAAAITGGDCLLRGARFDHLEAFLDKLVEAGVEVETEAEGLRVKRGGDLRAVDVRTAAFPGFATDLQAQMMALMTLASGSSVITETIFENRFMHALELLRMGADIKIEGARATVRGVRALSGAPVMATDLRASVSLILAGLAAENTTEVRRVYHLDRGYESIERKLSALGADVRREREART